MSAKTSEGAFLEMELPLWGLWEEITAYYEMHYVDMGGIKRLPKFHLRKMTVGKLDRNI
jgi:hypothetical protein